MLLTISTTRPPATDLGWLLHKHPAKVQSFELAFGQAHVFYPEAGDTRCTAALVLDVDPVGLVRRRGGPAGEGFSLQQYVNDRPYVASSFMSVAIGRVYGSALGGRCPQRPELVDEILPLEARIAVLRVGSAAGRTDGGGEAFLRRLFEPLEYEVAAERHALDPAFSDWGESNYFTVTLRGRQRLQDLLTHLYVLIPVLDNEKHYWVGEDELAKLLRQGEGWLAQHPEREAITTRYLKHQRRLAREALARLAEEDHPDPDAEVVAQEQEEAALEAGIGGGSHGGTKPRSHEGRRSDEVTEGRRDEGSHGGMKPRSHDGRRSDEGTEGRRDEGSHGGTKPRSHEGRRSDEGTEGRRDEGSHGGMKPRSHDGRRSDEGTEGRRDEGSHGGTQPRSHDGRGGHGGAEGCGDAGMGEGVPVGVGVDEGEERAESLHELRLATVLAALRAAGARSVVDLGCGEGKLLRLLLDDSVGHASGVPRFERIVGMDVSLRSLKVASERLRLDRLPPMKRQRIELLHGSLMYHDSRLRLEDGMPFDAAACVEVIEHLDPPRLAAFERTVFEFARPRTVVITTPNREYNVRFETLPADRLRHRDHRFEWTRAEFEAWARGVATRFGYVVRFLPVGPEDAEVGSPTQMGVFDGGG